MLSDVVILTEDELLHAAILAARFRIHDLLSGAQHKYGAESYNSWDMTMQGAFGELAVAKRTGRYWDGIGAFKKYGANDVRGLQVRACGIPDAHLILHPDDPNEVPFVLVTGTAPAFRVRGWLLGRDGKLEAFWRDHGKNGRPAFFVPQAVLRPIADLP